MNSQFDKQSFNINFKVTNLMFLALGIAQLLIFAVFYFLVQADDYKPQAELDSIFTFIVPSAGLIAMFISRLLYGQNILKVEQTNTIADKLNKYRTFKIISWAILEGAALFSLVSFFLTGNYFYVAVFIFVYGFFLFNRPSKEGFVIDMQVTGPLKEEILRN